MSFEKYLDRLAMNSKQIHLKEKNMVNSTSSNDTETSAQSNIYKNCQKCGSENLLLIGTKILTCGKCHAKFFIDSLKVQVNKDSQIDNKLNREVSIEKKPKEFKTYELRKGQTKSKEPEVIDLLDTSEDESESVKLSSQVTLNVTNGSTIIQKVDISNSKKIENPKNNICFNDWNIKKSDLVPFCEKKEFNEFRLGVKAFRMGRYLNLSKDANLATFTIDNGIYIKLLENDFHIGITIGNEDIIYSAAIFNHPYYFLCIQIKDDISRLYYEQLGTLDSFRKDEDGFLSNELNKSIVFMVLNIKKDESATALSRIQEFCQLNADISKQPLRSVFGVLNMAKSHELVHNCFKKDDGIVEITKFIKKYTLDKLEVKYPNIDQVDVVIKSTDLLCLREGEFLNDNIISFYLKYIQNELLSKEDRDRTHIFDTFFYEKLTQRASNKPSKDEEKTNAAERRYLRVKNWTRNVNIFKKDFLIIPINKNNHWYLAIICYPYLDEPQYQKNEVTSENLKENAGSNSSFLSCFSNEQSQDKKNDPVIPRIDTSNLNLVDESADEADDEIDDLKNKSTNLDLGPCVKMPGILMFDSLLNKKKRRVMATLKQYLQCEWDSKYSKIEGKREFSESLLGSTVEVPSQTNFFDCGIYLLQYVEHFFKKPIKDYNLPINLENWFPTSLINRQRNSIKEIIIQLFEFQKLNAIKKERPKEELKVQIETTTEPLVEPLNSTSHENEANKEKENSFSNRPKRYKLSNEIIDDMDFLV